jgi:excisionase family DNA binding protein
MNNDLELLTAPEAAKQLRISRSLAYELVARGRIPAIRLGRAIRIPRGSLETSPNRSAEIEASAALRGIGAAGVSTRDVPS